MRIIDVDVDLSADLNVDLDRTLMHIRNRLEHHHPSTWHNMIDTHIPLSRTIQ